MKKFRVIEKSRFLDDDALKQVKGGNLPPCNPYYCNAQGYAITPPCSIGVYDACPSHSPCGTSPNIDMSYLLCTMPNEFNANQYYQQMCLKNLQE